MQQGPHIMMPDVDVEKFQSDGYLIFRGVFDKERVANYRAIVDSKPLIPGDLLSQPELCELVFDPVITGIAAKLLGSKPTYFGYSSMSKAGTAGTAAWHRDNADRLDPLAPDWQGGPYTLIRFGLYMQDHKNFSGGLLMRPKSHLQENFRSSTLVYADTEPGDLAVWNMRILHAGDGWRRKVDRERAIDIPESKTISPDDVLPTPPGARYAAFITYGLSGDEHTERYIDYLATRSFMTNLWQKSKLSDRAKEMLPDAPFNYRHIWSEIKDRPNIGQNAGHVEKAHLVGATKWAEVRASH